jgi:glycosyltransferase involved in cell wall biosynthesis
LISDDGSSDDTGQIALEWCREHGIETQLQSGPQQRDFAANFRSLILSAPDDCTHYCFCDQDDVWLPGKLAHAAAALAAAPQKAALYCGRTRILARNGTSDGLSPLFARPAAFRNALVQSIAGGNTMVMNAAAFEMVRRAAALAPFVSHDWFSYQIVSGGGGAIIYDQTPRILYRQHDDNLIGSNTGYIGSLRRLVMLAQGRFERWNNVNVTALKACEDLLTADARDVLLAFSEARSGTLLRRLAALRRAGVYRQSRRGQVSLWLACMLDML